MTDIEHCRLKIAQEEALGHAAASPEAGEMHFQLAMLYKAQLATLTRPLRRRL